MAKHRKGELLTLEIEDLAYGGEGGARLGGYVGFVRGRIGGAGPAVVRPILGAPELYGYRNKMEFTIARDPNGQPVVGLHETGRYDAILDTERCLIQSDLLNNVLADVRAFVWERGLSIYD